MAQSLAAQFVVQVFFVDIGVEAPGLLIAVDAVAMLLLVIFTIGLYLRRRWAYLGVLPIFAVVLFGALFRAASGLTVKNPFVAVVAAILPAAQIITSLLGLLIGIFAAGREFEMSENRRVMRLGADLRLTDEMGDYYHVGKRYADQGLWAMAVPYWQRAAAADPTRSFYQRTLGEAYARLGFYARSLDALQSAGRATIDPKVKAEIEEMMEGVRQRMNNG
jgi:tetratricopeptide (TPR) repeat protein